MLVTWFLGLCMHLLGKTFNPVLTCVIYWWKGLHELLESLHLRLYPVLDHPFAGCLTATFCCCRIIFNLRYFYFFIIACYLKQWNYDMTNSKNNLKDQTTSLYSRPPSSCQQNHCIPRREAWTRRLKGCALFSLKKGSANTMMFFNLLSFSLEWSPNVSATHQQQWQ